MKASLFYAIVILASASSPILGEQSTNSIQQMETSGDTLGARTALASGDERTALGASRAMASIEQAKTLIPNNVSPALITAALLRDLSAELS